MGFVLKLMTDSDIRALSSGEVKSYGRFNFKFKHPKPIEDGLFCQKIFGPLRDYTCECGIIKRGPVSKDYRGEKCPTCSVEYIPSESRRYRMGHIELNTYYVNPLAYKLIADIIGCSEKFLKAISLGQINASIECTGNTGNLIDKDGNKYTLTLNPDGHINSIYELVLSMEQIGIDSNLTLMESNKTGRAYLKRGISLFELFNSTIVVPSPELRNIQMVGERIGFAPVNTLYTRLIRESIRISAINNASEEELDGVSKLEIIKYESQVIQKIINLLYVDGTMYGSITIPPIFEELKGKGGLIRGSMLGKRVDFSGRSVIASGPELPIDTIGMPFKMMYNLLKPHIIRELIKHYEFDGSNVASAIKRANYEYSKKTNLAQEFCERLTKSVMIMANRAPSLHRYSVMSFKVKTHHGKWIKFPPLACSPFNADFDGDTIGVHLILSDEAMEETRITSITSNLMSSAAYDKPNILPSHEMVVGAYLVSNNRGV